MHSTTPLKQKCARANNSPVNKTIVKTITTRARLKNNFFKNTYEANKRAYNAQRNLCFLGKKSKKGIL